MFKTLILSSLLLVLLTTSAEASWGWGWNYPHLRHYGLSRSCDYWSSWRYNPSSCFTSAPWIPLMYSCSHN